MVEREGSMRRRVLAVMGALALVVSACGGGDSSGCAGIADDAVELVQTLIDEIDGMSLEQLTEIGEEFAAGLESDFEELQTKADDASCTDAEMGDLVEERVGDLSAETQFGQLFIEQFRAQGFSG
jgi:hypothetical protein